jgi:hypothetical protein
MHRRGSHLLPDWAAQAGYMIEPALTRHKGRLIKTTGDGILAEFSSPISAVNCGIELQTQLAVRCTDLRRPRKTLASDVFGSGANRDVTPLASFPAIDVVFSMRAATGGRAEIPEHCNRQPLVLSAGVIVYNCKYAIVRSRFEVRHAISRGNVFQLLASNAARARPLARRRRAGLSRGGRPGSGTRRMSSR